MSQIKEQLSIAELATADYLLSDIFAMRQKWSKGSVFKMSRPRKSTGLIFLNNCEGEYTDKYGTSFFAPQKSLVCLPYGGEYSVLNVSCTEKSNDAFLIEFNIVQNDKIRTLGDAPFRIPCENPYLVSELMEMAVRSHEALLPSPAELRACIYRILSYLGKNNFLASASKYRTIAPAIQLLESNPLCDISVARMSKLCHMSEGSFRKLFTEYSGSSPIAYRIDVKLQMAKKMLDNSDMTIDQISEALDFSSGAYFCKLFKKRTGLTPKQYKKRG
ncbi:MAG: helix-turn-helix transcriptional regulator [Clostridia bacterium]|nr:helix-turn-helix transcriptional regulator [Clostridia bacterium]